MSHLKSSAMEFFNRMTYLDHKMDDLVFVAVLHQSLPKYMFNSGHPDRQSFFCGLGTVILICDNDNHFETHLGPTLFSLTTQFYDETRSDNYDLIDFPLHNDNTNFFADREFKKHAVFNQVQVAAYVLALELEQCPFPGISNALGSLQGWLNDENTLDTGCQSAIEAFDSFRVSKSRLLDKLENLQGALHKLKKILHSNK